MAFPLALLQQVSAIPGLNAPDPLAPDPSGNTPIVVPGSISDPTQDSIPYEDFNLRNGLAILERDRAFEDTEGAVDPSRADRRGPFGARGTLRDILGTIGDAFLVQSGNERIYAPRREQERLSDAMAGFTQDPMAAIERVAGINPEAAQAMLEQYQLNQDRTVDNERMAGQAQMEAGRERRLAVNDARDNAARLLAAAAASENPETAFAQVLPDIQRMAQTYGLSLDDIAVRSGMSPQELRMYAQAGMTPYQQQRIPQMQYGLETGRMNAETAQGRAAETGRHNRATEGQAAANEAGRNQRAAEAEAGRDRRSEASGNGNGPRTLRGATDTTAQENRPRFGRPRS